MWRGIAAQELGQFHSETGWARRGGVRGAGRGRSPIKALIIIANLRRASGNLGTIDRYREL